MLKKNHPEASDEVPVSVVPVVRELCVDKDPPVRSCHRAYPYLRHPRLVGHPQTIMSSNGIMTMRRCWIVLFCLWVAFCSSLGGRDVHAAVDAPTVQRAIDRGIAYLRKSQNARGGWEEYGGQSCGLSALCTLALLNAGVSREDPDMVRALRYLRSFEPNETYSVALQTLVYCQLGAAGDLPRIRRNVTWLIQTQKRQGVSPDRVGSWGYGRSMGSGDPSNAQFALLALGAAQDRGIDVEPAVFELALEYWKRRQREGGWAYGAGRRTSGSMTCAGIASIIIARDQLDSQSSMIQGNQIQCCGGSLEEQDPVETGLAWLARNFTLQVNPGGDQFTFYYYLYALERVGRLSGRRYIGQHDWYREGAQRLLELQDDFMGFWSGIGPMENREVATAFALLFLSKGKRQVVVGQLKYGGADGDQNEDRQWNQHPDALRQLVRHVERRWRRDLTWQTIVAESATLDDLLQSPVLIISGQKPLRFSDQIESRLRQYVDQGGCILFQADQGDGCGDASGFESSVAKLCERWFEGARLEKLPPTHPVWFAEQKVDPTVISEDFWVYGVQACCRTPVFYVPKSLSCRWELGGVLFHRDRGTESIRNQVQAAIGIGENVIAYATGRELKDKLEQRLVLDGQTPPAAARDAISVAMLALDAGGEQAARALPNAAALISNQVPIRLRAIGQPVGFDANQLLDVQFLWIHGRTDFQLTEAQRSVLRRFVEDGGVILASSICGSKAFTESFRREMAKVFPQSPLQPISRDHPVFQAAGGFDIRNVTIRTPAAGGATVSQRTGPPVLESISVDNVIGVFFSPLDLSCALESPNSIQCPGYPTEEAARIVANLILYGLQQ